MTEQQAMRMALELIEPIAHNSTDDPRGKAYEAITALRQALEQQPADEQEKYLMEVECTKCGAKQSGVLTVTLPQPAAWVGLTEEEKHTAAWSNGLFGDGVLWAEKLLKQRNT